MEESKNSHRATHSQRREGRGYTHILSSFIRLLFNPDHSWKECHSPHGVVRAIPPSCSPISVLSSNVPADTHMCFVSHTCFLIHSSGQPQSTLVVPDQATVSKSRLDLMRRTWSQKLLAQPFQWCGLTHHSFMGFGQLVAKGG